MPPRRVGTRPRPLPELKRQKEPATKTPALSGVLPFLEGIVDLSQFENWLKKLSDSDRKYLQKHPSWKRAYDQAKGGKLPKDFIEMTMEILEDGSESET